MSSERFVVLGLAHPRSTWSADVGRWATTAMAPVEFLRCLSPEEVLAHLDGGRALSAVLLDGTMVGVDRDLVDAAGTAGCTVIVVDNGSRRDWRTIGADAVLPPAFDRDQLVDLLVDRAQPVRRAELTPDDLVPPAPAERWQGALVAVTGPRGMGASTAAMALAQGLADDPRRRGLVLLADFALDATQAMLHDTRAVVPAVQELVEAHRHGQPDPVELRSLLFECEGRHHHLLLGLRRHRDWTALPRRAFEAALANLRANYRFVVADLDPDAEGEAQTGALDVADRNLMTRTTLAGADLVLVVATADLKGLHLLGRLVHDLADAGAPVERLQPVLTRAPRSPRGRAELTRALAALGPAPALDITLAPPVFLPERRRLDDLHRDGLPLPDALARPLAGATVEAVDRLGHRHGTAGPAPVAVAPGSLGHWSTDSATGPSAGTDQEAM